MITSEVRGILKSLWVVWWKIIQGILRIEGRVFVLKLDTLDVGWPAEPNAIRPRRFEYEPVYIYLVTF